LLAKAIHRIIKKGNSQISKHGLQWQMNDRPTRISCVCNNIREECESSRDLMGCDAE